MILNHDIGSITSLLVIDTTVASPLTSTTGVLTISGTGALTLPAGNNTTDRPGTPVNGMIRYNTSTSIVEFYNGTWNALASGSATVTSVAIASDTTTGLTVVSGSPITTAGTIHLALNGELNALAGLTTTGLIARTAANTYVPRTIVGTAGRVTVADGDGVVGAPTIDLATVTQGSTGTSFVKVAIDSYGRISNNTAVTSGDITGALGYTPINKAGDTVNGTLTFSAGTVTGLATPVAASDAATRSYVDNAVSSGTKWRNPIVTPDLMGILSAAPGSPITGLTYIVDTAGTWGALSVAVGDVVEWSGTVWVKLKTLTLGDRFIIGGESGSAYTVDVSLTGMTVSGTALDKPDLIQWIKSGAYIGSDLTTASNWSEPDGIATSAGNTMPNGVTVLSNNVNSVHYGHTYLYNNTTFSWAEIAGPGSVLVGNGLTYVGNTIVLVTPVTAANGGTGLSAYGTSNQILGMNNAGTALEYKTFSGTTNQVTLTNAAGSLTFSIPSTFVAPGSVQVTSGFYQPTSATVTAAGTNQGTATALTATYNVVTTAAAGTGVSLPVPTQGGWEVTVVNHGANEITLYPNSGAAIEGLATNVGLPLPAGAGIIILATSATQWYATHEIELAGTGISTTYNNGTVTFTNTGVTSIAGTTNQITASASTGAVTLSLPSTVTIGTSLTVSGLTANSFLYSGTAGLLTTTLAPTNGQLLIGSTGAAPVAATLTQGTGIAVTNGAGSITITNTGVTSIAGTANQITLSAATGSVTASIPTAFVAPGSVQITTGLYLSTNAAVTAAGTNQGTATALTASYNVITTATAGTGVVLPAPTSAGWEVFIVNKGANTVNIYPATGATIDSAGVNNPVTVPTGASITLVASSTTQWYTTSPVEVAGTGMSVTYGNGTITFANTGVTSVSLSLPSIFNVTTATVTTTGTLTAVLNTQTANLVFASPNGSSGTPAFRSLVYADLPIKLYVENPSTPTTPVASGVNSVAIGSGSTATAIGSVAVGSGTNATVWGGKVWANGNFATAGDAQAGMYILRTATINATPTEMFLDGATATQRLVIPNNSVVTFSIFVTARRTDATGGGASYKFEGGIRKDATAASTTFIGIPAKTVLGETNAVWDANIVADTTNGALSISVTGEVAKTIRWVAAVNTVEVTN